MTKEETIMALEVGIERANFARKKGIELIAGGDMGIGNTTPATALFCAFLGLPPLKVAGPGTGLKPQQVRHKARVIARALRINQAALSDPLETLAALGGLEIAGICGLCLGAASRRTAVAVDGFISTAGALAAMRLCPAVKDYLFFAHMSAEPGHRKLFAVENLRPVLDLGMRLGEGTGAASAMQILEDAVAVYNRMATFADIGITPGA